MLAELNLMEKSFLKFERRVASVCASAFEHTDSLSSALQACEGLFPTIAVSHFLTIDHNRTKRWIEQAIFGLQQRDVSVPIHNVSFFLSTWDFYPEHLELISAYTLNPNRRTCLLGVPSLAPLLSTMVVPRPHVLIDLRVRPTESTGSVICLSRDINTLNGHELYEAFDLCFLDPPWYVENYVKWIDIAGEYCRNGGTIAFSLLGRLTRPSADADRKLILEYCRARGLSVKIQKNVVLYDTPSFERHMLWRAGIPPVPWKRADLVIATRDRWEPSIHDILQPKPLPPFGQACAFGTLIDVIFDRYETAAKDLLLEPSGGYWMETPSRRVPGLSDCNVFTSNGAKFISPRPIDLFTALSSIEKRDQSVHWKEIELLGFPMDVFDKTADARKRAV